MSLNNSFTEEITNIGLANFINEIFTFLKSSKGKDTIIYKGYCYNFHRSNKNSIDHKCRKQHENDQGNKQECGLIFKLFKNCKFTHKDHPKHPPMEPIECKIKEIFN